jgi:aminoglycoside phosphotransferase (APT) family kinase protein
VQGIDETRVQDWLNRNVQGLEGPYQYTLIAGGRSNLTFLVTDTHGTQFVLRRPPLGHVLATAHDMAREHRLMAALADTAVPVPQMVGLCQDPSVNGCDFYVMRFLDGLVVRDVAIGSSLSESVRTQMCHALIDTLCALHRVDIDAVGLGNLAKREGYIERQLKRWSDLGFKRSNR